MNPLNSAVFCYVHDDDKIMEKIRHFLEEEYRLKCCIPQRNFDYNMTYYDEAERNILRSASTVVFLSVTALHNDIHSIERNLARHVELHRSFMHRVIYITLENLDDVSDLPTDLQVLMQYNEYIRWSENSDNSKSKFKQKLLSKIQRCL